MVHSSASTTNRKHFLKTKEDFVCEHCGTQVKGTGYTNHCPNCLWSKHVDLEVPGDRLNSCQSLMKPIGVEQKSGQWRIISQCLKCGKIHINDVSPNDNRKKISKLATKPVKLKEIKQ